MLQPPDREHACALTAAEEPSCVGRGGARFHRSRRAGPGHQSARDSAALLRALVSGSVGENPEQSAGLWSGWLRETASEHAGALTRSSVTSKGRLATKTSWAGGAAFGGFARLLLEGLAVAAAVSSSLTACAAAARSFGPRRRADLARFFGFASSALFSITSSVQQVELGGILCETLPRGKAESTKKAGRRHRIKR